MNTARCLNCDSVLPGHARFCPQCGQRTDTARLTLQEFRRELMHSFVNIERGPLALLRGLCLRPGLVAREYVEGRRRRHYGPFATLVVLVGLASLLANAAGFRLLAQDGLPDAPANLLVRHFNLLLLVQLPLLGAICGLVFRTARLTLTEHMVLVGYALCMRALLLALVVPLAFFGSLTAPTASQTWGFWAIWFAYFGWAASQFYRGPRWASAAKGVLAAALGHAAIMLMVKLFGLAYQALA